MFPVTPCEADEDHVNVAPAVPDRMITSALVSPLQITCGAGSRISGEGFTVTVKLAVAPTQPFF